MPEDAVTYQTANGSGAIPRRLKSHGFRGQDARYSANRPN
jgi:hypothetical protein